MHVNELNDLLMCMRHPYINARSLTKRYSTILLSFSNLNHIADTSVKQ